MKILGIPIERMKRWKRCPFLCAVVKITFKDDNDPENLKYLERRVHDIRRRSDMTAVWLGTIVHQMLERDDLDGLTIRSIDVEAIESVWSTPYDHLYPSKED